MDLCWSFCLVSFGFVTGLGQSYGRSLECTKKCTVNDSQSDCWRQTLKFFTHHLQDSVQNYMAVMTHLQRWDTMQPLSRYRVMAKAAAVGYVAAAERENTMLPLTAEAMLDIFAFILNKTQQVEEKYNHAEPSMPSFNCPIPCDYHHNIWMTLFFLLTAVFILLCISFFIYLCLQQHRMDKTRHR